MQRVNIMGTIELAVAVLALNLIFPVDAVAVQQQVQRQEVAQENQSHLLKASDLLSRDVRLRQQREGEGDYGEIEDLVLDQNGQVKYLIVSCNSFLVSGGRLVAVPWQVAHLVKQEDVVVLDVAQNKLANAPKIDWEMLESNIAAVDWRGINRFYGIAGVSQQPVAQQPVKMRQRQDKSLAEFNELDMNGDGVVTRQELHDMVQLVQRLERHFSRVDTDGDNTIDHSEFARFESGARTGADDGTMQDN